MKKRLVSLLVLLALALCLSTAAFAEAESGCRVVDRAGVIDDASLSELNAMADRVSESYRCDVTVALVPSLEGSGVQEYSDNFFLSSGYGYGAEQDGILLLISLREREYALSTSGYAITAFTDYGMQHYLEPRFTRYLKDDDWTGAARQFIGDAEELLRQARDGRPYDLYEEPARERSAGEKAGFAAVISAVIGFFSGGIPAGSMKRKMKSVEKEYGAANYVRGGLNLRRSEDRFLNASVSRVPIPRDNGPKSGHGGGSTIHVTSGHSFGGSHGKF